MEAGEHRLLADAVEPADPEGCFHALCPERIGELARPVAGDRLIGAAASGDDVLDGRAAREAVLRAARRVRQEAETGQDSPMGQRQPPGHGDSRLRRRLRADDDGDVFSAGFHGIGLRGRIEAPAISGPAGRRRPDARAEPG